MDAASAVRLTISLRPTQIEKETTMNLFSDGIVLSESQLFCDGITLSE